MTQRFLTIFRLTTLLLLHAGVAPATGDWPTCRGDAARSGFSTNPLPDDLVLLWHRNMGYPDAAFIHQTRMCADAAYAPVAANGLVFVPSNLHDEVTALDLATGKMVWRHITEGPVRFAPVFDKGKLYFGCDDGLLYCVEAATGKLLWNVRGAPDHLPDSRMLINGRLSSRWPVRAGPVLHEGTLFFGAGIWPEEGVYVSAINASTGKLIWRTDALSLQRDGMNDRVEIIEKKGRTIIKAPLRSQEASGTFKEKQPGPNELFAYRNRPLLNSDIFRVHDEVAYTEPVLNGDVLYTSILDDPAGYIVKRGETCVRYPEFDRIVARDMAHPRWLLLLEPGYLVRRLEFPVLWNLETPHKAHRVR